MRALSVTVGPPISEQAVLRLVGSALRQGPPREPEGLDYGAGFTMVLESNVTAAIRASTLPFSAAPVLMVMA